MGLGCLFSLLFFWPLQSYAAAPAVAPLQQSAVPLPAGELLAEAFAALTRNEEGECIALLQQALASGELNEAGHTLAYWYLFVAWQRQGAEDPSAEALLSFVTVAGDLLASGRQADFADADLFVERFGLRPRLARARATLSAVWAARADAFGRRRSLPVPVQSALERDYFLKLMVPCTSELHVCANHRTSATRISEVSVRCDEDGPAAQNIQRFYFERSANAAQ